MRSGIFLNITYSQSGNGGFKGGMASIGKAVAKQAKNKIYFLFPVTFSYNFST
jgi:hypothetical protein